MRLKVRLRLCAIVKTATPVATFAARTIVGEVDASAAEGKGFVTHVCRGLARLVPSAQRQSSSAFLLLVSPNLPLLLDFSYLSSASTQYTYLGGTSIKVRSEILHGFCLKFNSLYNGANNVEIDYMYTCSIGPRRANVACYSAATDGPILIYGYMQTLTHTHTTV